MESGQTNAAYYSSYPNYENNENEENEGEGEVFRRQCFQKFVIGIVNSKLFGGAILFIILLNTIILIIQTDEETSVKGGKQVDYKQFLVSILVYTI